MIKNVSSEVAPRIDIVERHLLAAVLEKALHDACLVPDSPEKYAHKVDALAWFRSNAITSDHEPREGFTFLDIADFLDLDIGLIRRFIAKASGPFCVEEFPRLRRVC